MFLDSEFTVKIAATGDLSCTCAYFDVWTCTFLFHLSLLLSQITGQNIQRDKKIIQEDIHHWKGEELPNATTQLSLQCTMQCNQRFLFCKSFGLSAVTFISRNNALLSQCVVHQDNIGFIREPLLWGQSRKDKWNFPRLWDSLSDNLGLDPDYCLTFSRGEILHRGRILQSLCFRLLGNSVRQAEPTPTFQSCSGVRECGRLNRLYLWLLIGHRRVLVQALISY